jgi:hypothetical protein
MPHEEAARKWQMKAEELRTWAETTKDQSAREIYLRLAGSCEARADQEASNGRHHKN